MVFMTYDNLGFRICGARAGYDQYTKVLTSFISPDQLKKVGFYRDPGQTAIDQTRTVWNDVRLSIDKSGILPTMIIRFLDCRY